MQTDIAAAGPTDFVVVTAEAIDTGSFRNRGDFVLTRDEAEIDEIGWNGRRARTDPEQLHK